MEGADNYNESQQEEQLPSSRRRAGIKPKRYHDSSDSEDNDLNADDDFLPEDVKGIVKSENIEPQSTPSTKKKVKQKAQTKKQKKEKDLTETGTAVKEKKIFKSKREGLMRITCSHCNKNLAYKAGLYFCCIDCSPTLNGLMGIGVERVP